MEKKDHLNIIAGVANIAELKRILSALRLHGKLKFVC